MTTGLKHEPVCPPRNGPADFPENLYLEAWATQAECVGHYFGWEETTFLRACARQIGFEDASQRHATVAASFFRWLGTGGGEIFVSEIYKIAFCNGDQKASVLGAQHWLFANSVVANQLKQRLPLVCSILAAEDQLPIDVKVEWDDIQLLEVLSGWLPTFAGHDFLDAVGQKIHKQKSLNVE